VEKSYKKRSKTRSLKKGEKKRRGEEAIKKRA
jgi:hypothetical protein